MAAEMASNAGLRPSLLFQALLEALPVDDHPLVLSLADFLDVVVGLYPKGQSPAINLDEFRSGDHRKPHRRRRKVRHVVTDADVVHARWDVPGQGVGTGHLHGQNQLRRREDVHAGVAGVMSGVFWPDGQAPLTLEAGGYFGQILWSTFLLMG